METEKKANLPIVTIVLAGINIVLFLIVDLFLFHRQSEIAYFMALNPVLVMRGEYWRLFTSMFYHFGIDHLVCNMLMLFILGSMLEPFSARCGMACFTLCPAWLRAEPLFCTTV